MERHPLGSQAFLPLNKRPYLIVVAALGNLSPGACAPSQREDGKESITQEGEEAGDFVVVDRGGEGPNLDEQALQEPVWLTEKAARGATEPG